MFIELIPFVYQRQQALVEHFTPAFLLQNKLCEPTTLEHKFKM